MATDGPPPDLGENDSPLAMIVIRVWREPGDDDLRGRLIAPSIPEPTAAAGRQQILGLVERALSAVGR
jgi:hypothetical protein